MNKALPWNVNGVGFDARDAAREAAHRQGKSLGEWLHGVIADHAADLGLDEKEMGGQQRINAVTSKLERLSARSADHDRRVRGGRGNDVTRRRAGLDRDEERDESARDGRPFGKATAETEPKRRREGSGSEVTELLLEEAIDAMELRALRAEQHTDNALQSFTKMLERTEAERNKERDSVSVLAQKLSDIESRLTNRFAQKTVDNPINGALARLEARLDNLGRRNVAEAAGPLPMPQAPPTPGQRQEPEQDQDPEPRQEAEQPIADMPVGTAQPVTSEPDVRTEPSQAAAPQPPKARTPLHRLEAKLNSILQPPVDTPVQDNGADGVVPQQARSSPPAGSVEPQPYGRLEAKLKTILATSPARASQPLPEASSIAIAAHHATDRRLGEAIANITKRQRMLEAADAHQASRQRTPPLKGATRQVQDLPPQDLPPQDLPPQDLPPQDLPPQDLPPQDLAPQDLATPDLPTQDLPNQDLPHRDEARRLPRQRDSSVDAARFGAMQHEIATLAATIEALRHDVVGQRGSRTKPTADLEALRAEIATMSGTLHDLVSRDVVSGLEISIQKLAESINASRGKGLKEAALRPVETLVGDLHLAVAGFDPRKSIAGLENDLAKIGDKIDGLNRAGLEISAIAPLHDRVREIRDLITAIATQPLAAERVGTQIESLNMRIDRKARHPTSSQDLGTKIEELRVLVADASDSGAFSEVKANIESLAAQIDEAVEAAARRVDIIGDAAPNTGGLGALELVVRELSQKLDAVQAPGASHEAFDALQRQVVLLSDRFERSEDGLAKLISLERSMSELFTHLDETRTNIEASSARAAREVLRIAMEEGRIQNDQATAASLATIQTLQEEAESRTNSTLGAVHGTLEKIVDRLSVMETDIVETHKRTPATTPPELRAQPIRESIETPDSLFDQILGHRPGNETEKPRAAAPESASVKGNDPAKGAETAKDDDAAARLPKTALHLSAENENGRADFIAAARRAAKVAQSDLAELKRTASARTAGAVRTGLIEQSRAFITRQKRPILLSIAALFVIAGTAEIVKLAGFEESDTQVAEATPPTSIVSVVDASNHPVRQVDGQDVKSPTDPIQTGSLQSLPSFVGGAAPDSRPKIAANLKAKAEAGDGAAEYALGVQYADGTVVQRDFALAARWYQKAADQNVAPAQYRLASLYEKGLGVTQDKTKAKALYLKAAEAGNPRSMHNLAVLMADGDGTPDYAGAATWFRKAAQYGIHDSQYNLAILLARGIGVKQSLVQSYQWFAIAASQGDADAAKKRDEVGAKMRANDVAVAKALATSFHPLVAESAATEVQAPAGGWDGAHAASPLNSARPKVSSL